jgi:putative transposase
MKELAQRHKRYGSPRIHILLKKEGFVINHKRTERIYKEEGLSIRKRTKKKHLLPLRIPMPEASRPNEVWSIDFMSDAYGERNLLRILTMVDDCTRISPGMLAQRSITGKVVTEFIDQASVLYGYPKRIRVDKGPEFTSRVFHQWALSRGILLDYIRPGKPTDNAFIESFNGKFRDECLNEHWFLTLRAAQQKIEAWRKQYNRQRPHSSLSGLTPYAFFKEQQTKNLTREGTVNLKVAQTMG